jgi:hypothetical protein
MPNSPNLILPYIEGGQSQKHVTHNDALRRLDAIINISVIAIQAAPPVSVADGDRYIVATGGSGLWVGMDTRIAAYQDGVWVFYSPRAGWQAYILSMRQLYTFDSNKWSGFNISSPNGAGSYFSIEEQEITLNGVNATSTTAQLRTNSTIFNVASRVTQAVTGATSFAVGVFGNLAQFGSGLNIANGSVNAGGVGPFYSYSDTPIIITSTGGNFTSGKVRIAITSLRTVNLQS